MDLIINLNKPSGLTSHQATARVRKLLGVRKAGHTGTLDPLATGVLLICLNEATKVTRFFLEMDKKYKVRLKLGERTDTCDSEGSLIEKKEVGSIGEAEIFKTVRMFSGRIMQRPPMYSAVKIRGETLYKLARKGIEIERPERPVEIYSIEITRMEPPYLDMAVSCSKGTYIRTLCDDIGIRLKTGAHLVSLERTAIGPFDIKNSITLDDLENKGLSIKKEAVYAIDTSLSELKEICLNQTDYGKARNGGCFTYDKDKGLHNNKFVRLKGPSGNLFGIGRVDSDIIRIERILNL